MKHFCDWILTWRLLHFIDISAAQRLVLQDTRGVILQQSHTIMELPEHVNRQWPNFYLGTASGLLVPITLQKGKKYPATKFTEQFLMAEDRKLRFQRQPQLHSFILSSLGFSFSNIFSLKISCHTEVKTYLSSSEWILPIWSFKGPTRNINLFIKKSYINVNMFLLLTLSYVAIF